MRQFADLHVLAPISDIKEVKAIISKSSELGYNYIGLTLSPNIKRQKIIALRKICNDVGIDLITRVDFAPKTPRELLNFLRRFRRKFELVSAICTSKSVARQAAKDRRVDLILFPEDPRKRFFDSAEAELASKSLASFEIDMSPLISLRGFPRTRLISCLRKEVKIASKFNVPIVISSGAANKYLLRTPHDYAALTTLFDLPIPDRLRTISENPNTIIDRNRGKLSPNFVAPGIRIIRRGKACVDA